MKKDLIVAILAVAFAFGSCCQPKSADTGSSFTEKTNNIVVIDKSAKKEFNDFVENVRLVKLETNDNCLISDLSSLVCYKDRIYIIGAEEQVVVFDNTGKHLFSLNKKGEGADEYVILRDFYVDDKGVHIYDSARGNLLHFSHDGMFLQKQTVYPSQDKIVPVEDGFLGFIFSPQANDYRVSLFDNNGAVIAQYLQEDAKRKCISSSYHKPLISVGRDFWLIGDLEPLITVLNGDGVPKDTIQFDFVGYNASKQLQKKNNLDKVHYPDRNDFESKVIFGLNSTHKIANWLSVETIGSVFYSTILYNLKTGDLLFMRDAKGFALEYTYGIWATSGEEFITELQVSSVIDVYKDIESLKDLDLSIEDNPVLCFFSLKN